ncbi:MAG TPA: hypothetical protein VLA31_05845, partial [Burkholderiaceae bacterium]|nr:hypothetical protein [Burkholderiaceae bacterium]
MAKELGRKPTKVSWEDYEAAVAAQDEGPHWARVREEAGAAIRDKAAGGLAGPGMDAAVSHWDAAGEAVKETLRGLMHQSAARACERRGGVDWGQNQRQFKAVRRWGRKFLANPLSLSLLTPLELAERWPSIADPRDPTRVPLRMQELWAEASHWANTAVGPDEVDSGCDTADEGEEDPVARAQRRATVWEKARRTQFRRLVRAELDACAAVCSEAKKKRTRARRRIDTEDADQAWVEGKTRSVYQRALGPKKVKIPADAVNTTQAVIDRLEAQRANEQRPQGAQELPVPLDSGPGTDQTPVLVTEADMMKRVVRDVGWKIGSTSMAGRENRRT